MSNKSSTYKDLVSSTTISDLEDKIRESKASSLRPTTSVDGIDNPRLSAQTKDDDDTQQIKGVSDNSLIDTDFLEVRKNIKALIKKGNTAVDKCVEGISSESYPKMIETLSDLIKTVLESNKELLQIHADKKTIKGIGSTLQIPQSDGGDTTVTQASAPMDSAAFGKMMDDAMKAETKK